MRHFWEDYLHEVLPNQIETYLVKTWSTRNAPRNGVLCNNATFLTARLALWLVGMRSQVEGTQFWNVGYSKSLSAQHTNFDNITFITVSEGKYKKSLAGKPLLVTKQPWRFCVKSGVDSPSIVSLESRIWPMDIYVVQLASIGPPREIFLGGTKPIWGL